jgi:hypothetical protein
MTLEDRLTRWEQRQEAIIASIHGLTDVMETNQATLMELMAWLQEPPSSDLPDTMKVFATALTALQDLAVRHGEEIQRFGRRLDDLPAQVARAVKTGEVL